MASGRVGSLFRLLLLAALMGLPRWAMADPVKADVSASVAGGYARLVFTMSDYDDASVRQDGSVLIINFKAPLAVSVDRLATQAPDYIGGARRDPDGMAVRLALARQVTVHAMSAGDKYFVDLLPTDWSGLPPGLPQDVVEALARRARAAETLAARESRIAGLGKIPPVRVQFASEPTFDRYIFGVPSQVAVAAKRDKSGLTLDFDAPLKFDLGDVVALQSPTVSAIKAQLHDVSASVRFDLAANVEVRSFRDENGYAVDVVRPAAAPGANIAVLAAPKVTAPQVVPPAPPVPHPDAAPASPARKSGDAGAAAKPPAPPLKPAASTPAKPGAAAITAPAGPSRAAAKPPVPRPVSKTDQQSQRAPPPVAPTPTDAKTMVAEKKADLASSVPPSAVKTVKPAPVRTPQHGKPSGKIAVELARDGENLKLSFDFLAPTAAAVFDRADTLWMVFDSHADIDLGALKDEASRTIRSAELTRAPDADIVRIKLNRPLLASVGSEGSAWTVEIGDNVAEPTQALDLERNLVGPDRSSMTIEIAAPHALHRVTDREAGDQLLVVTAFAPARGLADTQNFVEFRALASEQGVAIEPLADDVNMALAPDRVVISRPKGLTLSSSLHTLFHGNALHALTFDPQLWGFDLKGSYEGRQSELIAAAAAAPESKRLAPRVDLARFYLARSMYAEAKGVLDVVLAEKRPVAENVIPAVLRAVAEIMMDRPDAALKDLDGPSIGDQHDAPLWRALAYARQGKWSRARESFKRVEASIAALPVELQQFALKQEMRAAIEVGDFADAERELNDLQTIGIPHDMQPAISVLIGRLDEGVGHDGDALAAYRAAADSWDGPAAAQGRLRQTLLRYSLGELKRKNVVSDLESLTTVWRGDETEIEALAVLARLYTDEGRYRDSFYVMRSAMAAHPDWDLTRKIQDQAAKTFDSLFLGGRGDSLPPIDALALFYDFRELTPIGSRGDEMIRRLADRLVSVDLLDQAAGLLQYQVDNRLQGAARAQVATRLAVIYLMNRKPDQALATLRASRSDDLSNDLRDQRLLLEARALSDLGRHAVALEVIADVTGPVAIRLRSDIHWAAHEWRQAAEQIELLYGERWKQWQPLSDVERSDILRAEIGYALAADKIGLERFREKYAAKMAGTPDARVFQIASAPLGGGDEDFKDVARAAAAADTLDDFLRELKARYSDANPIASLPPANALATSLTPAAAQPSAEQAPPGPLSPPRTRPAATAPPATTSALPPLDDGQTAMR